MIPESEKKIAARAAEAETPDPNPLTEAAQTAEPRPRPHSTWPVIGLFLFAAVAVLIYAQALIVPIVFAFLLAVTFSPIRRAADHVGIPSGITAGLIVAGLFALIAAAIYGLSQPVRTYVTDAPSLIQEFERKLLPLSSTVETVAEAGEKVEELAVEGEGAPEVKVEERGPIAKFVTTMPLVLGQITLSLVLLFFILASGDMFYEKTVHSISRFRDKRRAVEIVRDIEAKLSRYFLTIAIINAGLGVAIGTAMWLLGMPNPILFGVIAFFFNFVPYVGAMAGVVLAFGIGVLTFETLGPAFAAGIIYFLLTSFEGQFVTPYAVGRSLKLNTVIVFLAVAFWGWLWSIVGMIVAMPLLIALRVFCEHVPRLQALGNFLSARHAENGTPQRGQAKKTAYPANP